MILRALGLFLSLALVIGLAGCSSAPGSIKAPRQSLNLRLGGNPTHFNPILATDQPSSTVNGLIFNGLMKVDTNLEMIPDLAESYTVSPDNLHYTFKLRKNVTWHDGTPFTAEDVKFTFDKILDSKTNTVRRSSYIIDGKPIQFKVLDTHTIQATLPKPFAPFLSAMGMGIIPKHRFDGKNINTAKENQHPIGTGPFKFDNYQTAEFVLLRRFDHFYNGAPKLATIILKIIPDSNTAILAFENNEIDSVGLLPKDVKRIESSPKSKVYKYYDLQYVYMGFNLKKEPFSDITFRQAIAHAINQNKLVDAVLKGYGMPARIPQSPVSWAYPQNTPLPHYEYNPEKSKALLATLGYVQNPETGFVEKNGSPFEFTILTNNGNPYRKKSAEIIQQYLHKVGIKTNIRMMEWSGFIKVINNPNPPKKFDAVILGWGLGVDPDSTSIWSSTQYPRGFNFIGFDNTAVDQLLQKGRLTLDKTNRQSIYKSLYTILAKELPYYFLYIPETVVGVNTRVKGLAKPGPTGLFYHIEKIYIQE